MTEIFTNISDDIKEKVKVIWNITLAQPNPIKAANFLNDVTEYYKKRWTEEEVDFLQFYFQTQMEMNKK